MNHCFFLLFACPKSKQKRQQAAMTAAACIARSALELLCCQASLLLSLEIKI
jgi:hypothetical protein